MTKTFIKNPFASASLPPLSLLPRMIMIPAIMAQETEMYTPAVMINWKTLCSATNVASPKFSYIPAFDSFPYISNGLVRTLPTAKSIFSPSSLPDSLCLSFFCKSLCIPHGFFIFATFFPIFLHFLPKKS